MNDIIARLAFQSSNPKTGWLDRQKFAELIVRECVQRLIDHSPAKFTNEVAEEEWDKGYDQAMEDSINHIKEHFGVEE